MDRSILLCPFNICFIYSCLERSPCLLCVLGTGLCPISKNDFFTWGRIRQQTHFPYGLATYPSLNLYSTRVSVIWHSFQFLSCFSTTVPSRWSSFAFYLGLLGELPVGRSVLINIIMSAGISRTYYPSASLRTNKWHINIVQGSPRWFVSLRLLTGS